MSPELNVPERPTKKRKTVSISKLFSKRSLSKQSKPTPKIKKKKSPPHPIVGEIDGSLSATREHLQATTLSSLASAHSELITHLASASEATSSHFTSQASLHSSLARPLDLDPLSFKGKDGAVKFTRTIGERVEKFERDVARLKEGIGGLWKEWEGVQEEVKKVVEELEKEGLEEVNEAREKEEAWKRRVEEVCEGWVERVKESERELQVREKQKRKTLAKAIQDYDE